MTGSLSLFGCSLVMDSMSLVVDWLRNMGGRELPWALGVRVWRWGMRVFLPIAWASKPPCGVVVML